MKSLQTAGTSVERGTHVGSGEFLEALVFGQLADESPGGAQHERVDRRRPRLEDADRPTRHLGEDVEPVGLGLLEQPEVLSPQVRCVVRAG